MQEDRSGRRFLLLNIMTLILIQNIPSLKNNPDITPRTLFPSNNCEMTLLVIAA